MFSQELELQIQRRCVVFGPLRSRWQEGFSDHLKRDAFNKKMERRLRSLGDLQTAILAWS